MHNKESHKTPYAIRAAAKKGRRDGAEDSQTMEEDKSHSLAHPLFPNFWNMRP